ncbi:vasoactive intestinal polypeptide receptor 1b isoform X1 [Nerophis lumbriciformis]|uniref:vasoactive intestinal polypeptide receptor 1b isoform X1 n=2 Tax=Nerophis lumbriciformis TaxID=546530 RepID=UPI002ADFFC52|nr:vasoactive intestinal polypeptide receptor 1b isoform X1 [Nerophis lumbriciformis]
MDSSPSLLVLVLLGCHLPEALTLHMCDVVNDIELERQRCENSTSENVTSGCGGEWDMVTCWPSAQVGQVVTITCPAYFSYFSEQHKAGNLSKTCTADGWTEMRPLDIALNCGYNINSTSDEGKFFWQVKIGYTVGHSVSLVSLTTAIAVLCIFRKLHCTRNYIHMHLFVSFVLKAIAVLIKDVVLYEVGEVDNCTSSSVGCKVAMVFFQYAIMASFFWLLVEGLYLHALLAVSFFSERKYFWAYILIGWGGPAVFIAAWSVAKTYYNDVGCWDIIETSDVFWWIIKAPILASILMNFILFICIIRILRQKINCPDIGRNESNQYSRLAKSTLLLIPLFGINFIVFAFIPEQVKTQIRLVFDLILGSFQGFVVAVLYCFLNAEVQGELRRKWRRWHLQRHVTADSKSQQPSSNFSTQISLLTRCSPKSRRASSANHQHMSRL